MANAWRSLTPCISGQSKSGLPTNNEILEDSAGLLRPPFYPAVASRRCSSLLCSLFLLTCAPADVRHRIRRRNVQRPLFRAILSSHFTQLAAAGLLLMMEFICALFQSVLLGWLLAAMAEAAGGTAVDVNNTNNSTDNMMLDTAPNISSDMSATTIPTTTRRDVYGYAAALSASKYTNSPLHFARSEDTGGAFSLSSSLVGIVPTECLP